MLGYVCDSNGDVHSEDNNKKVVKSLLPPLLCFHISESTGHILLCLICTVSSTSHGQSLTPSIALMRSRRCKESEGMG
eukprot:m.102292 g.102292  ORF g.102292 m.102292 type:complete len:78 (-) comp9075_c0_seq1:31-264(-)